MTPRAKACRQTTGLSDGAVRKKVLLKEALAGGGEAGEGISRD